MYKGFMSVIKKGQAKEVIFSTNNPFSWFPELRPLFDNFDIKELEIEINKPEGVFRKFFRIKKVDNS